MVNDAEMANSALPSPDPKVTDLLTKAYGLEGTAGNECYDAGRHQPEQLAKSRARRHQGGGALQRGAPAHPGRSTGKVPVTTTTTGNTGNSGNGGSSDDDGGVARTRGERGELDRHRRQVLLGHPHRPLPGRRPRRHEISLMTADLVVQVCLEPKLVAVAVEQDSVTAAARRAPGAPSPSRILEPGRTRRGWPRRQAGDRGRARADGRSSPCRPRGRPRSGRAPAGAGRRVGSFECPPHSRRGARGPHSVRQRGRRRRGRTGAEVCGWRTPGCTTAAEVAGGLSLAVALRRVLGRRSMRSVKIPSTNSASASPIMAKSAKSAGPAGGTAGVRAPRSAACRVRTASARWRNRATISSGSKKKKKKKKKKKIFFFGGGGCGHRGQRRGSDGAGHPQGRRRVGVRGHRRVPPRPELLVDPGHRLSPWPASHYNVKAVGRARNGLAVGAERQGADRV